MRLHPSRLNSVYPAIGLGFALSMLLTSYHAVALQIEFDYSYDTEGFFDDPERRGLLELAGRHVNRYVDRLEPIVPGAGRQWFTFAPVPPSADKFLNDMDIAADTIKIIVGGSSVLPEATLSQTTVPPASILPDSSSAPEWENLLASRGQPGALESPPTDFANWGGVINFNSDDVKWHFGETTEGLDLDETDFLTLAMHELTHILGFGPADSFIAYVESDNLRFAGSEAISVGSGTNRQLEMADPGHWRRQTLSFAGGREQRSLMTPEILPGERKYPTLLDRAALRDVGWQEALPGDANLDGQFDTLDLVQVMQAGKYRGPGIVAWADGDWNDDLRFDQRDIIAALSAGTYRTGPYSAVALSSRRSHGQTSLADDAALTSISVPEPSTWALSTVGLLTLLCSGHPRRHVPQHQNLGGRVEPRGGSLYGA